MSKITKNISTKNFYYIQCFIIFIFYIEKIMITLNSNISTSDILYFNSSLKINGGTDVANDLTISGKFNSYYTNNSDWGA